MTHIGTHVEFDDEDGNTLHGTVFHLLPCLTNGRKHAVIELDSKLPGITHTVALDNLRVIAQRPNFVFIGADFSRSDSSSQTTVFTLP